jgi:hypothetical protein
MAVKYTKKPKNILTSSLARPSKITQIPIFLSENIPSGNPAGISRVRPLATCKRKVTPSNLNAEIALSLSFEFCFSSDRQSDRLASIGFEKNVDYFRPCRKMRKMISLRIYFSQVHTMAMHIKL